MPELDEKYKEITPGLTFTLRGKGDDDEEFDEDDFDPDDETAETGNDDDSATNGGDYDKGMEILDVMVYGEIGDSLFEPGIGSKAFADNLGKFPKARRINLMINSVGGDVFEAQAIYNQLKRHKAKKIVTIDGLAASSASIIAMAGDEIIMPSGSMMMIHNAWTVAAGDYRDMDKASDTLKEVTATIANVYKDKTGLTLAQLKDMMDEETWMSSSKAKKMGFATGSKGKVKAMAILDDKMVFVNGISFDARRFKNLPSRIKKIESSTVELKKEIEMTPEEIQAKVDAGAVQAVAAERARIAELTDLEAPETHEIVAEAKSSGKTAGQILKSCFDAVKARKTETVAAPVDDKQGKEYLAELAKASAASVVVNSGDDHIAKPSQDKKVDIAGEGQMTMDEFVTKFSNIKVK